MSSTSRRRLSMAAGAVLAGAAIPIAAAGTAWADDSSENGQPAVPVAAVGSVPPAVASLTSPTGASPNITPATTQTVAQLINEGLSQNEATAVYTAEQNGTAVEVSYKGQTVVDANQGGTAATDATATSGAKANDVAAAIGGASTSSATGAGAVAFDDGANPTGNGDSAIAHGKNASAYIDGSTGTTATAAAFSQASSNDDTGGTVKANGFNAQADSSDNTSSTDSATGKYAVVNATGDTSTTATATGAHTVVSSTTDDSSMLTARNGGEVNAKNDTSVTLTASGGNPLIDESQAQVNSSNDIGEKATSTGINSYMITSGNRTDASGTGTVVTVSNGGAAVAQDDFGGSETVTGHQGGGYVGGYGSRGYLLDSTDSTVISRNTGTHFSLLGLGGTNVYGDATVANATDSSATAIGAGSTAIVEGYTDPVQGDLEPTNAHATNTNGTLTVVVSSDTSQINALPESHPAEMTPLTEVQAAPVQTEPIADMHTLP